MKTLPMVLALGLLAMTASAQTAENLRVVSPAKIRVLQTPATPTATTPSTPSTPTPSACGNFGTEYAGMCWDKQAQFGTYFSMAAHCGDNGGRLPMLGELAGFMAHFAITGIECSSDFDAGAGTLWCASSTGVSGMGLSQQAKSLYEVKAEFRCLRPLPRQ
jgi:hypothetical protein